MSIKEKIQEMKSQIDSIRNNQEQKAYQAALAISAVVKRRVINERVNHEGNEFGEYSDSYQKTRGKKNLSGNKVNFSYSNEMWRTTLPRVVSNENNKVVIIIQPDPKNVDKMGYNEDRFGKIVQMNDKEKELHQEIYLKEII